MDSEYIFNIPHLPGAVVDQIRTRVEDKYIDDVIEESARLNGLRRKMRLYREEQQEYIFPAASIEEDIARTDQSIQNTKNNIVRSRIMLAHLNQMKIFNETHN
jgi:hypothetical protein